MELTLVPLLLPSIQSELGLSIGQLAWVFNSYGIAVAIGVLLGGWFGDAFNTKRVFSFGVLLFAFGSGVVALSGEVAPIIIGRILQGLGGGIFSPLIPLLLTRSSPDRPGRILIVWGSVAGYVAAFAPFLYGITLAVHSWSLAFVIFAVVSLAALVVVNGSPSDQIAADDTSPDYANLLRSPGLWLIFGYVFCTYGAITYYLFRLPLWLADNEYQLASIGFTLSTMWLSFSIISTLLRNWVDRPHLRIILLAAPILIAIGFPLAYFCHEISCLIVSAILIGSGLACSNAPSTHMVLKFAPKGMSAISASLDITFARLGGVVTVALLAQSMFGYAVITIGIMSIAGFIFALAANRINHGK